MYIYICINLPNSWYQMPTKTLYILLLVGTRIWAPFFVVPILKWKENKPQYVAQFSLIRKWVSIYFIKSNIKSKFENGWLHVIASENTVWRRDSDIHQYYSHGDKNVIRHTYLRLYRLNHVRLEKIYYLSSYNDTYKKYVNKFFILTIILG